MKRILFFTYRPYLNATSRQRIYSFLKYLEKDNIKYKICPPFSNKQYTKLINSKNKIDILSVFLLSIINRLIQIPQVLLYDSIVIQQELLFLGPPIFEYVVRFLNKNIIYDYDDANFALYSHARKKSFFIDYNKNKKIIKISKKVIAGSPNLEKYSSRYNPNTYLIPTCIDLNQYDTPKTNKRLTIGWIGTPGNLKYIHMIKLPLQKLSKKYDFDLKVVSSKKLTLPSINLINKRWSLAEEIKDLHSFGIGVVPIEDNAYSRGKCGYKLIQYMAAGIPSVASPVGVNKEIIIHGKNGFLASDKKDWFIYLDKLIKNKQLRIRMGKEAKKSAKQYDLHRHANKFINILMN